MEKFTKDITDIVINEVNNINEKIRGLNFLELLKINIIEKILPLINNQKFPLEQMFDYNEDLKNNSRNIKITIKYYNNSLSVSKRSFDVDTLFLIFNEYSNFDIFKDDKNFTTILLQQNTGISIPKDTIMNYKLNKNALLLEISNIDAEQILTK